MTLKQQIEELKKEVEQLKFKIALLEARPMVVMVPSPAPPVQPLNPWTPNYPYIGDPISPSVTCISDANYSGNPAPNVQMSAQQSSLVQ